MHNLYILKKIMFALIRQEYLSEPEIKIIMC